MDFVRDQYRASQPGHLLRDQPRSAGKRLRASLYGRPAGWTGYQSRASGASLETRPILLRFGAAVVVATIGFVATSQAYINFASALPDARVLGSQALPEDTLIYASDGTTLLADLHDPGVQRYYVPCGQGAKVVTPENICPGMGSYLPAATIAIEDANYLREPGIDPQGIARAAWIDWRTHQTAQGASTITQQLIKLRLLTSEVSLDRKIKEAALAMQVSQTFSKQQVLEMYLNTVFYGNDAYGAEAAAQIYFHTTANKLTLGQATMLAGIVQNPSYHNPLINFQEARVRQHEVLDAMVRQRMLSAAQADQAFAQDISPPKNMFSLQDEPVPTQGITPGFVKYVRDFLVSKYGQKGTFEGGLRVYTTLDMNLQQMAQKAITDQVDHAHWNGESIPLGARQGALVSLDPRTGAVLAMVGSAHSDRDGGQFNLATDYPTNPGSSMKIYTYTAAIESTRFTMETQLQDTRITITSPGQPPWSPTDFGGVIHGVTCPLEQCVGSSLNIPAVKTEITLPDGVASMIDMARRMGAPPMPSKSQPDSCQAAGENAPASDCFGYSSTLGSEGETPLHMATGASTLAAQGVLHPPYGVSHIETSDGQEIFKADPGSIAKQVLDPKVAFIMASILSDGVNRNLGFGTGLANTLLIDGQTVAMKTGTTDDFKDGWTVGFTPSIATAVWMGNADNTPMNGIWGESAFSAAPPFKDYMTGALKYLKKDNEWFSEPPGLLHDTGWHGQTIYLLPGTTKYQPAPPLPPNAHSGDACPPNNGNGNNNGNSSGNGNNNCPPNNGGGGH